MLGQHSRLVAALGLLIVVVAGCLRTTTEEPFTGSEAFIASSPTPAALPTLPPLPLPTLPESPTPLVVAQGATVTTDPNQFVPFTTPTFTPTMAIVQQQPGATLDPRFVQATQIVQMETQNALNTLIAMTPSVVVLPTLTFTPIATLTPTRPPGPVPGVADCIHQVMPGETLYGLSVRYGVLVRDITRASQIAIEAPLQINQRLTIPLCGTSGVTPPPTHTPSPLAEQRAPTVSSDNQQTTNQQTVTGGGATLAPTAVVRAGNVRHVVEQGQTLFEIALIYGVPMDVIAAANNIQDVNMIFFNDVIIVP